MKIIHLFLILFCLNVSCYEIVDETAETHAKRSSGFKLESELTGSAYVYGQRNTFTWCGGFQSQGYYEGTYWVNFVDSIIDQIIYSKPRF